MQSAIGWVSHGAINYLAERIPVAPAEAFGVADFYDLIATEPRPPRVAWVCDDIACRARGVDADLRVLEDLAGFPQLSMELILAYLFAPVSFVIGVPWDEAFRAGTFLGEKVILNEFLAYLHFSPEIENFSERGQVAITVALCGFANLTGLAVLLDFVAGVLGDSVGLVAFPAGAKHRGRHSHVQADREPPCRPQ